MKIMAIKSEIISEENINKRSGKKISGEKRNNGSEK